ncbi:MAG: D-glycero-beta-D-manno-heptose 1-phosphate adenylyltransferase [Candidatus Omnitrophica bacterium]|nr:D-glycero-beta-D-manno-heptose 1-phosphate adenylyltransferase [Candidatus Omnitrophota bacterium]
MQNKIKKIDELKSIIDTERQSKKRIVFTNGCFDILHAGHVKYLEDAKKEGELLIVAINSDASVKKIKEKGRPVIGQDDRASVVAALESVDYVTIFDEETPINVIKQLMPDVLVKGGDWDEKNIVGADLVKSNKGKVVVIPFIKGRATSAIIDKIKKTQY